MHYTLVNAPYKISDRTDLPLNHKDPFDRMLIAQAQLEGLSILTNDQAFAAYDVAIFW